MLDESDKKKLLELSRELKKLDKEMVRRYVNNEDYNNLEIKFLEIKQELIKIISKSDYPIRLYDQEAVLTLKKLRDGKLSFIEKKFERFLKLFDAFENGKLNLSEDSELRKIFLSALKDTDTNDEEKDFSDKFFELVDEIDTYVGIDRFFENKIKFSSLFVSSPLPSYFDGIFFTIRWCYIFDLSFAVIGLCRVLMEIAFRDKYIKYFSIQKKGRNVKEISEYRIGLEEIRRVSKKLGLGDRAEKLYKDASIYLHGRFEKSIDDLEFAHKTFNLIEDMYNKY